MNIEIEIPDRDIRDAVQRAAQSAVSAFDGVFSQRIRAAANSAVIAVDLHALVKAVVERVVGAIVEEAVTTALKKRAKLVADQVLTGSDLFAGGERE